MHTVPYQAIPWIAIECYGLASGQADFGIDPGTLDGSSQNRPSAVLLTTSQYICPKRYVTVDILGPPLIVSDGMSKE